MNDRAELIRRLRIKADMITMGEKIEWGSDSAIMREAADALAAAPAVPDGVAEIYVGDNQFAICDWADWPLVRGYWWRLTTRNHNGCLYAQTWRYQKATKRERLTMHRLIMGDAADGLMVDHINGNGLDNRRANLRIATAQENSSNSRPRGGSSRFKGVSLEGATGLWRAYIRKNGKRVYLGRFSSEVDAAHAYNIAAKEVQGEYAFLNNID